MAVKTEAIDKVVVDAIEAVLRRRMGRYGYKSATIRADLDHANEPALFIVAEYDLVPEPIDAGATVGLVSELCDALHEIGETRFPYINNNFDERQAVARPKRRRRS